MEEIEIRKFTEMCEGNLLNYKPMNISGISFDSRLVKKNSAFFALKDKRDGHHYLNDAFCREAGCFIVSNKNILSLPNTILVKNTLLAMWNFCRAYKNIFNSVKTICITGSNGKTTTKEITKSILSMSADTVSNYKNFNNHIGLPVSITNIEKKTKYAVFECGGNHLSEISDLSSIASPDIALITNIGKAHIGHLGNIKKILKMKLGIFKGLKKDGTKILNTDDPYLRNIYNELTGKKVSFGFNPGADIFTLKIKEKLDHIEAEISCFNKKFNIKINCAGIFNIYNVLGAIAIACVLGISKDKIVQGISNFKPEKSRMNIIKYKNAIIIDDSYNSNPVSLSSAIIAAEKYFLELKKENKKINSFNVIIGDMLELGKFTKTEHVNIGVLLSKINPDKVWTVGRYSKYINDFLRKKSFIKAEHFKNIYALKKKLREKILNGGLFLFKGSNKIGLYKIVEEVIK